MTGRPVLWTKTARTDLNHIVDFIADNDAATALVVARRIEARSETLRHHPERGVLDARRDLSSLLFERLVR